MARNEDGSKGKKCNECGGYGRTTPANGASGFCWFCRGTGVEMPDIWQMREDLDVLMGKKPAKAEPTFLVPVLPWYARLIRKLAHLD